ncbi:Zn-ribbon domain-containing OB-fold protein [Chloroflexota bacterium]
MDKKIFSKKINRIPINDGFFTMPLDPLDQVRLRGSHCRVCDEVFLGRRLSCENCGSEDLDEKVLSKRGKLYTYTIIEHRPAGDYKGPDPFIPFGLGLVELLEGFRIVAPLTENDPMQLKIGMELELVIDKLFDDEEGNEVIAFKFRPL